ncbi:uncharacterized protein B0J16DRAFT_346332 [Fusarium flagelliforme]|uniref:uncharacterized protein n=1 Tax=Fusarium flagelliforme TaxID=2675880 RepID=UPI001E8D5421|nr:uncharacterized protein B0J16DRAFT_346332 [Fusarium flagelliforme]KAH7179141.1 hypothetical protein B0J16DRAFT_346332 [Fusarium flagelliforme]
MMWHRQFLQAWEEWGVHEMPESKAEWVEWAAKLRTTRTTAMMSRHALGKPKTEITWVTVAAVLANLRWNEESIRNGHGLEWAKRAQHKFNEVLSLSW